MYLTGLSHVDHPVDLKNTWPSQGRLPGAVSSWGGKQAHVLRTGVEVRSPILPGSNSQVHPWSHPLDDLLQQTQRTTYCVI